MDQHATRETTKETTKETLTITDNRTGKSYELPIKDGTIRALDLRQIKVGAEDFGMMTYDPAFMNTASCRSAITFIDGDKGILRYRGYPIEQLAEKASFLEVAWLLRHGELPTQQEYDQWVADITYHTYVHENIKTFLQGFRYDAHPMAMLCSTVAALSSFYPEAKNIHDPEQRAMLLHLEGRALRRPKFGEVFDPWSTQNGPRGFGAHAFTGTRLVYAMLEDRVVVADELWGLVGLGVAPYVEYGGAWYAEREAARLGGDAGLALRLGSPRSSRGDVAELDVSWRWGDGFTGSPWALTFRKSFTLK